MTELVEVPANLRHYVELFLQPGPHRHHIIDYVVVVGCRFIGRDSPSMQDFQLASLNKNFDPVLKIDPFEVKASEKVYISHSIRSLPILPKLTNHTFKDHFCRLITPPHPLHPPRIQMRMRHHVHVKRPLRGDVFNTRLYKQTED